MDASKKRKLMAIGGLNTCFKQDEAMLADISAIASRLAVGNDMCEDQCPNAPNLLAAHRLLVDDVVDHSTAPDQEAGYSSPEIHAMLQQDLGKEIFYKWRRGDLAQQELTRLVLECLVTRRVVAADNKEAAELSLNNSWQAFAGMDEEDKLFWEDGHWYMMAQCTHTRARSVSFSLARSLSLALSHTHTHTHTRYYVVSLFCIVTMSPCFYSRFALGRVRPQVARCVVAITDNIPARMTLLGYTPQEIWAEVNPATCEKILAGDATQGYDRYRLSKACHAQRRDGMAHCRERRAAEAEARLIRRGMVLNSDGKKCCALCFETIESLLECHLNNYCHLSHQFHKGQRMQPSGCVAEYFLGESGHTTAERQLLERSSFIVRARRRVDDEFDGDFQSALATDPRGKHDRRAPLMSAEDLKASTKKSWQKIDAENRRGAAQLLIKVAAWKKLPMRIRKLVLADPHLTLAQAQAQLL
jgi:hypothetical protein